MVNKNIEKDIKMLCNKKQKARVILFEILEYTNYFEIRYGDTRLNKYLIEEYSKLLENRYILKRELIDYDRFINALATSINGGN